MVVCALAKSFERIVLTDSSSVCLDHLCSPVLCLFETLIYVLDHVEAAYVLWVYVMFAQDLFLLCTCLQLHMREQSSRPCNLNV